MKALTISCIMLVGVLLVRPALADSFCFEEAGALYGISPVLLWSISKGESGFNSRAVGWNTNGTYDYGLMQINSRWEPTLRKMGIPWSSLADPCTNIKVGAWILANCISEYGYNWKGVGCYNSRTPLHRNRYANRIAKIVKSATKQPVSQFQAKADPAPNQHAETPWQAVFGN